MKLPATLFLLVARGVSVLAGLLLGVAISAAVTAAEAADYPLTRDGQPACAIVVAPAPSEAAQFAAFELQETLRIITGATVPIVDDRQPVTGTKIFVGESEATRELGLKSADFEPQEYLVRFLPEAVVLIGRDRPYRGLKVDYGDFKTYPDIWSDMATCHAVYDFLEKHCGVRWYAPGELGTVCEARPTLTVAAPDQEVRRKPAMVFRDIQTPQGADSVQLTGEDTVSGVEWNRFLRRLRLGGELFRAGHSTGSLYFYHWDKIRPNHHWSTTAPMKDWFRGRRPELFAKGYEDDAVAWSSMRGWFAPGDRLPPQPCLSEPDTLAFFAERARDYFAADDVRLRHFQGIWTGGPFFPFHWDDNYWFCKCADCQSQIDPADAVMIQDGKGHGRFSNGAVSRYYFGFANQLAREIVKTHPDRFVGTLAYARTARHPGFELEPNIAVQLCTQTRNFWCPATRTNETDIYDEWINREGGKRPLYLWLYYEFPVEAGHSRKFTPFPGFFASQVAADWKRYPADGIRGFFIQSSWAFPGKFFHDQLELHLASKLSDDPTLDGEALIDEFFTRSYGAAAGPMRAFYELIEKTFHDPTNYPEGIRSGALELHQSEELAWKWLGTPARMAELAALMEQAKAAPTTAAEKQRVALFERGIWVPMIAAATTYAAQHAAQPAPDEAAGEPAPRWDLARDAVPADLRHGGTYRDDGTVSLAAGEWFGVPASAFPDQRNFTVQITVSFPEVVEGGHTNVLLKQRPDGEETGFGLSCLHGKPSWARFFRPIINGMHIHDPLGRTQLTFEPDRRFSFTVAARDGMLTYYLDDAPKTKHFTILLPNDEPLWIGRKLHAGERPLPRMEVLGLTVHGPEFRYVSPQEPAVAEPRAAIAGKQWAIDAPTVTDPKRPKILFYGDSISAGYRRYLLPALEGKVYAYHWCHFVAGLEPSATPLMREAAASADYRAIFFNNGLHSLHWTPEKATDEQIERQTRAIVRGFREGAPQARLFWLATTPHCARPPAPGEAVAALGDKNDVVLRINRIAAEVMREEGVEVIDVYTPLAARLDLSAGDEYHWHGPALELIAKAVADHTLEVVAEPRP